MQLQDKQASSCRPRGDLSSDLQGPPLPEVKGKPGPAPALPGSPLGRNWCFTRRLHIGERQSRGHHVNSDSGHKGGKPALYRRATQVLDAIPSYLRTNIKNLRAKFFPRSQPSRLTASACLLSKELQRVQASGESDRLYFF